VKHFILKEVCFMKFDVVVIGGGHAGIEAAYIASKKNISVLLLTNNIDLIGQMSCNPSIGGIAKGNIVREIDALGGIMGKIIDSTGIHFKMLNQTKGTAVWGNRAQADKVRYREKALFELENRKNIWLHQALAVKINEKNGSVNSVLLNSGETIETKAIIIATGTFLNGVIHIGLNSYKAGRIGEPPSEFFTESIRELGITSGRLKTGTSPRIDARTVDYNEMEIQKGDEHPWPFSYSTKFKIENKAVCWITESNSETHKAILNSLDRSPLYSGKIKSVGPRYCPSIEDKIVRFGERNGHTLFLEPESLKNHEMYLNGLSTSLPFDVQQKMVNSVKGLKQAKILRPGYGIEYDYFQPTQLYPTLESKIVRNLFFAGQINGTSGYEEAACQGLIAGINAAQNVLGEESLTLGRDTSYIGVLIDDLITKGTEEPYRMFTSRAEYRLLLRQDNSDERLMPIAYKYGFLEKEIYDESVKRWDEKVKIINKIKELKIEKENKKYQLFEYIKRPEVFLNDYLELFESPLDFQIVTTIESDIKYEGFIKKDQAEIEKRKKFENCILDIHFDYDKVSGLLNETKEKLKKFKPYSLGQASRIQGVTPADISILIMHIAKKS
jgi:tRNA uridine 5-carboxymethylaminomethyl modification enzyme